MKSFILPATGALALALGAYLILKPGPADTPMVSASDPAEGAPIVEVVLPDMLSANAKIGKHAFDAACAACHGENAAGKQGFGPPLVHDYYKPSHHGDMAFVVAAERGVQAHHWNFGNMPPQTGLTRGDIKAIIAYVREMQLANGIQ